jgi:hypothetical protein
VDPYIPSFLYDVPTLQLWSSIWFLQFTLDSHTHDLTEHYVAANFQGQTIGGNGAVTGNKVTFTLNPDLTKWNGGLNSLDLKLQFQVQVRDHDHGSGDDDDNMDFDILQQAILLLGTHDMLFQSNHASHSNKPHIHCQAEFGIQSLLHGLTETVLDAGAARISTRSLLIKCSHSQMGGCVINHNWDA